MFGVLDGILEMRKTLTRLEIEKAAECDILYFIRRCQDQPDLAQNGKG